MEKKYPIRVLQSGMSYNHGGIETYIMNYCRHIDRDLVQFDFIVSTIAFKEDIKMGEDL